MNTKEENLHKYASVIVWVCGGLALLVMIFGQNEGACALLLGIGAAISFIDEFFSSPLLTIISVLGTIGALVGIGKVQSNQSFLVSMAISYAMSLALPYYIRTSKWTRWMTSEGRAAARQEKLMATRAKGAST